MAKDSEKEILADWNKYMGPDHLSRAFGYGKDFKPEEDIEAIYRQLKSLAENHGKQGRVPIEKKFDDTVNRKMAREANDRFIEFYTRIKNLKKQKKGG